MKQIRTFHRFTTEIWAQCQQAFTRVFETVTAFLFIPTNLFHQNHCRLLTILEYFCIFGDIFSVYLL